MSLAGSEASHAEMDEAHKSATVESRRINFIFVLLIESSFYCGRLGLFRYNLR